MKAFTLPLLLTMGLGLASFPAVCGATEFTSYTFTYRLDTRVDPARYGYLQYKASMQDELYRDIQEQVVNNLESFEQHPLLARTEAASEQDPRLTGE